MGQMNARTAPLQRRESSLVSLPKELLQAIYLYSMEPNLALSSSILGACLSSEIIYRLTLYTAFWNPKPVHFHIIPGGNTPPYEYGPGPETLALLRPSSHVPNATLEQRRRLQEIILVRSWCTFDRMKLCFSRLLIAVCHDMFHEQSIDHDLETLDATMSKLPETAARLEMITLDSSTIRIEFHGRLNASFSISYTGPNSRFALRHTDNCSIRPVKSLAIPDSYLRGSPWTDSKLDRLRLLDGLHLSKIALHKGMASAIQQGHYTALLILAVRLHRACYSNKNSWRDDAAPEIPGRLFQLVAKRPSNTASKMLRSVRLFKVLLRLHAESMPKRDKIVESWARRCVRGSLAVKAFGQWVLDFSQRDKEDEYEARSGQVGTVRRPMFDGGWCSKDLLDHGRSGMLRRFEMIDGQVVSFGAELGIMIPPYL